MNLKTCVFFFEYLIRLRVIAKIPVVYFGVVYFPGYFCSLHCINGPNQPKKLPVVDDRAVVPPGSKNNKQQINRIQQNQNNQARIQQQQEIQAKHNQLIENIQKASVQQEFSSKQISSTKITVPNTQNEQNSQNTLNIPLSILKNGENRTEQFQNTQNSPNLIKRRQSSPSALLTEPPNFSKTSILPLTTEQTETTNMNPAKRFPSFKADRSKSVDYGSLRKPREKQVEYSIELAKPTVGENGKVSGLFTGTRDFDKSCEGGVADILDFDSMEWKERMKMQSEKTKKKLRENAKQDKIYRELENEQMMALLAKRRNSQPDVIFETKEEEECRGFLNEFNLMVELMMVEFTEKSQNS